MYTLSIYKSSKVMDSKLIIKYEDETADKWMGK